MSYQVLARKWRPRTFHELVGQEHVSRALVNALDQGRLHHAYLFTGTRGVGKTTLARILAKCLNCETGVTSRPCGQCRTCQDIDQGRFVDLIEVDAASRTRVEDTRELLDNVQYAPTQGRYKVYLIDEVHMLSAHSFNALLKTLEEPPPHVRFLLATTDPQKLPITVLSRCLQFALKRMTPERIVEHLDHVLTQEQTAFDTAALWLLGRAADGSMRDAMSLTDQAIAFGHGEVRENDVIAMLGTLDHRQILALAESLAGGDAADVLARVAHLAEQGPDFAGVLDALCGVFHRLAIAQMVPAALDNAQGDRDALVALAAHFTAEDVQLYYQIALNGRGDMDNAPEQRTALEMTLLRMLAFRPQGAPALEGKPLPIRGSDSSTTPLSSASEASPAPEAPGQSAPVVDAPRDQALPQGESFDNEAVTASAEPPAPVEPAAPEPAPPWNDDDATVSLVDAAESAAYGEALHEEVGETTPADDVQPSVTPDVPTVADTHQALFESGPAGAATPALEEGDEDEQDDALDEYMNEAVGENAGGQARALEAMVEGLSEEVDPSAPEAPEAPAEEASTLDRTPALPVEADHTPIDNARWLELFPGLGLSGMTANLVANCVVHHDDGDRLDMWLHHSQSAMNAEVHRERLEKALVARGLSRRVTIEVGEIAEHIETPARRRARLEKARLQRAIEALRDDPHIQSLQEVFGARLVERSVTSFEQDDVDAGR
ncbi:DNA polymerase III, gamma subunit /DNA polymerase III, tau subunit [Kushneria avicenniae]|uniref:DNA polymerase III subunit gamma/tau n=1 Tax=Kushneria avicenniae TaxID=402385 RepID=A0A1I1IJK6_9GAMM|nr:DNA polymerase III subunit gamma/tau [Kushneria avicenniae]SFC36426.1 DNA polymerase III, gamma subunit /DNA polymerase III, tau subunit [Kushneria avicenniae]